MADVCRDQHLMTTRIIVGLAAMYVTLVRRAEAESVMILVLKANHFVMIAAWILVLIMKIVGLAAMYVEAEDIASLARAPVQLVFQSVMIDA